MVYRTFGVGPSPLPSWSGSTYNMVRKKAQHKAAIVRKHSKEIVISTNLTFFRGH